jgi:peptidoglycan/LPS O-acetylase OafA/YrhL
MPLEDRRSIPSLDGLRAISISLVLLAHASLFPDFPKRLELTSHFALLGVRVFYVISGYLITTLLLRELTRSPRIDLRRFYFRRTLRIFPPYYVFLGCVALAGAMGILSMGGARWIPAVTYTSNILSTGSWFIGHSWTLSMEEQFYIC